MWKGVRQLNTVLSNIRTYFLRGLLCILLTRTDFPQYLHTDVMRLPLNRPRSLLLYTVLLKCVILLLYTVLLKCVILSFHIMYVRQLASWCWKNTSEMKLWKSLVYAARGRRSCVDSTTALCYKSSIDLGYCNQSNTFQIWNPLTLIVQTLVIYKLFPHFLVFSCPETIYPISDMSAASIQWHEYCIHSP